MRFGFGWSRSGIRVTWRRSHSGDRCSRSSTGSRRRGDRHPDQAVAAAGDVVGVAGQVPDQEVALPGPVPRDPVAYDAARGRLGHRDVVLGPAERDPVREAETRRGPPRRRRRAPSRSSRPVRVSWTKSSFQWSMPNLRGGVGEPDGAVARRSRRCCRRPWASRRPGRPPARPLRWRCRRGARRAGRRRRAAGRRGASSRPSGRPPVWATRSMRRASWLTRKMLPSSVPVNTAPSSRPAVPTTTSSAPGPGTGTRVSSMRPCSRAGRLHGRQSLAWRVCLRRGR